MHQYSYNVYMLNMLYCWSVMHVLRGTDGDGCFLESIILLIVLPARLTEAVLAFLVLHAS